MAPLAKKQNIILVSICKKAPEPRKPHNDHHSLGDLMASADKKWTYNSVLYELLKLTIF